MNDLDIEVQYIKGVGPKRARLLKKLGINNLQELLYYIPKSYDDRTIFKKIDECHIGEKSSFRLRVIGSATTLRPKRNMSILKIPVTDGMTNAYLIWFNQEYIKFQFESNKTYLVNGIKKVAGGEIQITNVKFEEENENNKNGEIIPVYGLTDGISNKVLGNIVLNALSVYYNSIPEFIPKSIMDKYKMMDRKEAIKNIHFPPNRDTLIRAKNRLILEEFLTLQLGLSMIKKQNTDKNTGLNMGEEKIALAFKESLPFKLTNAQENVLGEIFKDMKSDKQMNRLVQGDVGSGKTLVALIAMIKAVESGYQGAMMAPTEILASQHYASISNFLKDFDINIGLLIGSLKKREKDEVLTKLKDGDIDILIGTHALIQEGVDFKKLGLVVTDEQHRFGVKQRADLSNKGNNPDILVMTATPIPRTLALILYGDLDISIIDELPPGRKEIETYAVGLEAKDRINSFINKQIQSGRQCYIVCPLIEESEKLDIKSAEELYEDLKNNDFKDIAMELLHGKMKSVDKDEIMSRFKNGETSILISTTVIEVGVDVPNANIILIYNAERFGLAQLHQLRGRVGRGEHQSYCILLNASNNKISRERMRVMQSSSDGFVISEKDLELRGPGEFFGTRQHGIPELKIANLFTDMKILKLAQGEIEELLDRDPQLRENENQAIKMEVINKFNNLGNISFN